MNEHVEVLERALKEREQTIEAENKLADEIITNALKAFALPDEHKICIVHEKERIGVYSERKMDDNIIVGFTIEEKYDKGRIFKKVKESLLENKNLSNYLSIISHEHTVIELSLKK